MRKSRTFKRFGSVIAIGLLTAGFAGLPSITGADGGNGNPGGNGNGNGRNAGNHGNAASNGNGNGAAGKVVICHIPPGNPGNSHAIEVSEAAVPAHLGHGDTVGPCAVPTTTTEATTTSTTSSTTSTTVPISPSVTVSYRPTSDESFCLVVINPADFEPSRVTTSP